MLMAGRAAQQIVVGKVSAGSAGSDESGCPGSAPLRQNWFS